MNLLRWKPRSTLSLTAAILYTLSRSVVGVSLTGCASSNTGTSSTSSHYMTNGLCHDYCGPKGFAFAITQFDQCWCSDVAPATTDSTGTGSCDIACPGFPSELCGNKAQGLYGYIALGKKPTSTAGGGGFGSFSANAPFVSDGFGDGNAGGGAFDASSFFSPSKPSTVFQTSIIVSTQKAPAYTPPPSTTPDPVTVVQTSTASPTPVVVLPQSSDNHPETVVQSVTATVSSKPKVVASVMTVKGSIMTSSVTAPASTAYATATTIPEKALPLRTHAGLSNGAVAGITIGAVAGLALLGALLFFLCWRPRRRRRDSENGMKRSSSILSRTGLLRSPTDAGGSAPALAAGAAPTLPRLQTGISGQHDGPVSAGTLGSSEMSDRRLSRPMFVDDRLNPNALMQQANASRTSVGTLQDNQDYSRPLEVRNA